MFTQSDELKTMPSHSETGAGTVIAVLEKTILVGSVSSKNWVIYPRVTTTNLHMDTSVSTLR